MVTTQPLRDRNSALKILITPPVSRKSTQASCTAYDEFLLQQRNRLAPEFYAKLLNGEGHL